MSTEICPHIETCIIYKNYIEQTKDNILDIILYTDRKYKCLAKSALEDSNTAEGRIPNKEIKERLQNLSSPCSHITLLNSVLNPYKP